MKRLRSAAFLIALTLLAGTFFPVCAEEKTQPQKVRVGYFTYSSYQNIGQDGNYFGYGYEYLREIAKYTGWEYEFIPISREDGINLLETDKIDLLGGVKKSAGEGRNIDFAQQQSGLSYSVLCVAEENRAYAYDDFQAFDGMRVAAEPDPDREADFQDYCGRNHFSVQLKTYPDHDAALAAVHAGEADAILTSNLQDMGEDRVVASFAPTPFYYAVKDGNTELLDGLNYALSQIKLINRIYDSELYNKYYPIDVEDKPVFTSAERDYISQTKTLRAVYSTNWAPIEYADPATGAFRGMAADIFEVLTLNTGLEFQFIPSDSLEDAVKMLENGDADVICGFERAPDWAEQHDVILTNPYLSCSNVLVTRREGKKTDSVAALTEWRYSSEQFESRERGHYQIQYYPTIRACFDALKSGQADVTYANSYLANWLRIDYRYSAFNATPISGQKDEMCVAIPRAADRRLLSILNKGILYISESQLNEIIVANTVTNTRVSLRDIVYQYPVATLVLCSGFFMLVIFALVYIFVIRSRTNRRIQDLLYKDSVTGAWNLNRFRLEGEKLLKEGRSGSYALVSTDIDRFRFFNDTYGFGAADKILIGIAAQFREALAEGEIFARVSADHFVALLNYESEEALLVRLRALREKINSIPHTAQESFRIFLSTGVYVLLPNDKDIIFAIDCANEARKTIKYKGNCAFYSEELRQAMLEEREIEAAMGPAINGGQFVPYFQPKFDLRTGRIVGAEALARWKHPTKGLVQPLGFIPLFEKTGFIIELDFSIYTQVCATLRGWLNESRQVVPISSNFSRVNLRRKDFVHRIVDIANQYGVPHSLLELEITESAAEESAELLRDILNELKAEGFLIAMDDFGTGYSSLTLLQMLPVDTLKLDKEFLQKGLASEKERVIVEGFIRIARQLRIKTVCEGVETEDQEAFLQSIDCDMAQGYLFAHPEPIEIFDADLLTQQSVDEGVIYGTYQQ